MHYLFNVLRLRVVTYRSPGMDGGERSAEARLIGEGNKYMIYDGLLPYDGVIPYWVDHSRIDIVMDAFAIVIMGVIQGGRVALERSQSTPGLSNGILGMTVAIQLQYSAPTIRIQN